MKGPSAQPDPQALPLDVRITECDPGASALLGRRQDSLYATPPVIPSLSGGRSVLPALEKSLAWTTILAAEGEGANFFYTRFGDDPGCEVRTEEDDAFRQPSSSTESSVEGVSGSPAFLSDSRELVIVGIDGSLMRYAISDDAWPADCQSGADCLWADTTPSGDIGPDSSPLVAADHGVVVWGNLCNTNFACQGPNPEEPEYGDIVVADLATGSVLGRAALHAWTFCAPVSVPGPSDDLYFIQGTGESAADGGLAFAPFDPEYDCALVVSRWDGGELTVVDHWDDERQGFADSCLAPTVVDGVNAFFGEPVPFDVGDGGDLRLVALRRRGEIYRFRFDAFTASVELEHAVTFEAPGDVALRFAAQHTLVTGRFPDDPSKQMLFAAARDANASGGRTDIVLAVDPDLDCDGQLTCTVPAAEHALHSFVAPDGSSEPVWGPGVAVRVEDDAGAHLGYALAVGATARALAGDLVGDLSCASDDVPPQLHLWYRSSTDAAWTHRAVDLGADCYQVDGVGSGPDATVYVPIEVVASPVVEGSRVYVLTGDGRSWELETAGGDVVIAGYSGDWPRLRGGSTALAAWN